MGGVEGSNWFDLMIDEIGGALTIVDKSIQKSMELWTELTKDIFEKQPTQDTTGQPNNGKSGKEDSSQDIPVAEVKESPVQHWAMRLAEATEIPSQHWALRLGEAKEISSQHWAMSASKIPESLIQEQGDDDYCEDDCDDYDDYDDYDDDDDDDDVDDDDDDDYDEEEEDTRVSESSESMLWEFNLGTSATIYPPNCYHHHNEEANVSSLKWKNGNELLKDVDTPSEEEEDESTVSESCENMWEINKLGPQGSCYLPPGNTLYYEEDIYNALYMRRREQLLKNESTSSKEDDESWDDDEEEEEDESIASESCENMLELNLGTSATSHIPSYHHHSEEDSGSSSRCKSGYELLKNDDKSSEEDDDSWDEEVKEWLRKHGIMSDITNEAEDEDEDEDDVSDKLEGFVDVKEEEEVVNNTESGEAETVLPECDWVYVTRD